MDEVIVLLLLSVTMFMGCYMAGVIPLVVTLSGDKLQLVTVLGAGMLVGTALSVIIPEGVNMLYSSHLALIRNQLLREQQITTDKAQLSSSLEKEHSLHILTDIGETHSVIGVTLVLGFIFMLLIDQIGSAYTRISNSDAEAGPKEDRYRITATLGLVVHAAADGIALGAAVTTSHTDIEMIVFLAIMLHKAPAAFGLVTFLLHEGLDRNRIRKHLLIFALAAPLLAVITYFSISQLSFQIVREITIWLDWNVPPLDLAGKSTIRSISDLHTPYEKWSFECSLTKNFIMVASFVKGANFRIKCYNLVRVVSLFFLTIIWD
ncbi:zinc transporter ZIP9-like isoform X1 [Limulus polyphemus]|uniref:Zinc transporter ZIP9-like isoform X1 n=1 Tax=Limulus polyphemus TaxID=6850 RepID=A0ABM1T5L3_LIMPO|nr:zinc transporter ZIP9-like isoform X1 [Limulus polyphemus]